MCRRGHLARVILMTRPHATMYMFTTYKRFRCVALQSASTNLNDLLMSTAEVHPWQSEATCHGHRADVESVDSSGTLVLVDS